MNKSAWQVMVGVLIALTPSCEQVIGLSRPDAGPPAVFDALWQDVNDRYSYFEEKAIDWQTVRNTYRPLVSAGMSERDLFDLLSDMLFTLQDGHVNLISDFDRSRNWEWFLDHPPNFNVNVLERGYLGRDYRQIGPFQAQLLDDVLLVYYGSFADAIQEEHLEALFQLAEGTKGLIFDIRNNGGGSQRNAERIASCLTASPTIYARRRVKTGPSPADFSAWEDLVITPRKSRPYEGKVAVLTNRRCFSAANTFAQMAQVLPNAVLIGDRSGGGGGTPVYGELPNGWTYRFSATQTISPDGAQLEFGVPVDIEVTLRPEDERAGVDTIIERALEWVGG